MKTIWKFPLDVTQVNVFRLPKETRLLSFQMQTNVPTLWGLVDLRRANDQEERTFVIFGTGHNIEYRDSRLVYVGTAIDEPFVWHLFEAKTPRSSHSDVRTRGKRAKVNQYAPLVHPCSGPSAEAYRPAEKRPAPYLKNRRKP